MIPNRTRHGKRPGPKPTFRLDDAIDAALAEGIRDFTIGGVAKRLNVAPSALYRVVADRDALVHEAIRRILQDYNPAPADLPWQDQVRLNSAELWMIVSRYEGVSTILLLAPDLYGVIKDLVHQVVNNYVNVGLPLDKALFAVDTVTEMILVGSVSYASLKENSSNEFRSESGDPIKPVLGHDIRLHLQRKIDFVIAGIEQDLLKSYEQVRAGDTWITSAIEEADEADVVTEAEFIEEAAEEAEGFNR